MRVLADVSCWRAEWCESSFTLHLKGAKVEDRVEGCVKWLGFGFAPFELHRGPLDRGGGGRSYQGYAFALGRKGSPFAERCSAFQA